MWVRVLSTLRLGQSILQYYLLHSVAPPPVKNVLGSSVIVPPSNAPCPYRVVSGNAPRQMGNQLVLGVTTADVLVDPYDLHGREVGAALLRSER